jgi:hypothetical protein
MSGKLRDRSSEIGYCPDLEPSQPEANSEVV